MNTDLPPQEALKIIPYLNTDDVCDAIIYVLSTPSHVQVKRKLTNIIKNLYYLQYYNKKKFIFQIKELLITPVL